MDRGELANQYWTILHICPHTICENPFLNSLDNILKQYPIYSGNIIFNNLVKS